MATTEPVTPPRLSAKALMRLHGPTGSLILRLRRYALLGWILFGVVLVALIAQSFFYALKPVPVIAVDASGKVLGTFEYLDGSARTDQEIVHSAKSFIDYRFSANSATIWDDFAAAATLMSPELYEREKSAVEDGSLITIEKSGARSFNEFDDKGTQLVKRDGLRAEVRGVGKTIIGKDNRQEVAFDITLVLEVIPRTPDNTTGILVHDYWYN